MKEEGPSPSLLDTSHQPTRSGCCPARGGRCGTWLPQHRHGQSAKLGEAAASFSLHFSVLPNFNVKENVGHFKSIGRQLFLTQRIMGFSTMNCTSSGRINFDFFFPHVFIYMWLYFHWYRIKSAFYWPGLLVLLLLMSSGTAKARAPVFLAKAERGLLGLMSKMQSYF